MKRLILTGALLAAILTPNRIYEDDPRWNCQTMGNHICGSQTGESQ